MCFGYIFPFVFLTHNVLCVLIFMKILRSNYSFYFNVYNLAASNFDALIFHPNMKREDLTYAKLSMSFPLSPSVNCFALTKRRLTLGAVMQINPFTAGCLHSSHCSIELARAVIRKG